MTDQPEFKAGMSHPVPCGAEIEVPGSLAGRRMCQGYLLPCQKQVMNYSGGLAYPKDFTEGYWKCSQCSREVK